MPNPVIPNPNTTLLYIAQKAQGRAEADQEPSEITDPNTTKHRVLGQGRALGRTFSPSQNDGRLHPGTIN